MVFSSVPVYLDPHNWHQQPNHQQGDGSENPHELPLPPPPHQVGGSGLGSIRPGSMADRARLAKLPQPEPGLKCPRCESPNTKFCYFNNYSLTQPRHFCKTCRRYWTRGGALRNVPVGGGCRRNKRSKSSSRSKSPVLSSAERQRGFPDNYNSSCSTEISGHFPLPPPPSQLPLMGSLQSLTQYGGTGNIGLNFGGIQGGGGQSDHHMGFQLGSNSSGGSAIFPQHFPLLGNFEAPTAGLYPFQSEGVESQQSSLVAGDGQFRSVMSNSGITQLSAPVKMEGNRGLNLSKQFLGISENNQYWGAGGNTWTDFSGLNSSSSTPNLI